MKIYRAWRLDAERYQQDRSIVLIEREDDQERLIRFLSRLELEVLRDDLVGLPGDSLVFSPEAGLLYLTVTIKPAKPRQRQSSPKAVAAARANGALGGRPVVTPEYTKNAETGEIFLKFEFVGGNGLQPMLKRRGERIAEAEGVAVEDLRICATGYSKSGEYCATYIKSQGERCWRVV